MVKTRLLLVAVLVAITIRASFQSRIVRSKQPCTSTDPDPDESLHLDVSSLFSRDPQPFVNLIRNLRNEINRSHDGIITVVLSHGETNVRLVIRREDVYLVGFVSNARFVALDPSHESLCQMAIGANSSSVFSLGLNYGDIARHAGQPFSSVNMDPRSLVSAVHDLSIFGRPGSAKRAKLAADIMRVIIWICEAARFQPIKERIVWAIHEQTSFNLNENFVLSSNQQMQLSLLVNNWDHLTTISSQGEARWNFGGQQFDMSIMQEILALALYKCKPGAPRKPRISGTSLSCSPQSAASGGIKMFDTLLVNPDNSNEYYVFRGDKYVLIDLSRDILVDPPLTIYQNWPPFFTFVDAFLTTPIKHEVYVFSGDQYGLIDIHRGSMQAKHVRTFASGWPALAAVGLDRVDAVLQSPANENEAYFFRSTRYVLYSLERGEVILGPKLIAEEWPSLRQAGFQSVDAAIPVPGKPAEAYFIRGTQMVRVRVQPGTNSDELLDNSVDLSTKRSLFEAHFTGSHNLAEEPPFSQDELK